MLTFDDLLRINKEICEEYDQTSVIINKDNLLSALSVQDFDDEDGEHKAVKLFRNIIITHGFQDANKRTACVAIGLLCPPFCDDITIAKQAVKIANGDYKDDIEDLVRIFYRKNIEESFEDLNEVEKAKVITIINDKYKSSLDDFIKDLLSGKYSKKVEYVISEPRNSFEIAKQDMSNGEGKVIYRYFIDNDDSGKIFVYVNVK